MTDTSSLFTTHPITNPYPVTPATTVTASAPPLPNGTLSEPVVQDEEEYTIKCICIYTDDDGNTVYCPKCDTWQHIECYYHGKKVPEEHFCSDCFGRELDGRRATERQRRAREQLEGGDRKVKRPASKTSKKKHKDSIPNEQINGWSNHDRHDSISNGKDQPPPAKKPKVNHKASASVVSVNGESRKRAYSNVQSYPSPSRSPQDIYRFPIIPQYTPEFLELYERDEGRTDAPDNEYTIPALNHLSTLKSDRSRIIDESDQPPTMKAPFVYTSRDLEHYSWPRVALQTFKRGDVEFDGKHPTWRYLRLQQQVQKDALVGEIRGEVGMLDEYCQQQSNQNRWLELSHPDPFVFFHPHMNIYIDSRRKGTQFRYLRRSCQPNVTLKTFISDFGDMRHCFVANRDIPAGTELTAAWFINNGMFDMSVSREDLEQLELESQQCDWISRVLANFGDCACDKTQCPWARLDRRSSLKASDISVKIPAGRKKKGKSKQAVSPLSTGHATNSRAGSETIKGQEDDEQYDRRSTTDSSRSGGRSRDLTPVNNVAVLDADPVLGNGLTARELRKIQAAEKIFERKEGGGDKKKKKRISGGSNLNTPTANSSKQLALSPGPADSKQFSGSPPSLRPNDTSVRSGTNLKVQKANRPIYTSVAVQTDPVDCEISVPPPKRRKFSTPTQRLLKKVLRDRMAYEQQCGIPPDVNTPRTLLSSSQPAHDVEMKNSGTEVSPGRTFPPDTFLTSQTVSATDVTMTDSPSVTLPSQAAHTQHHFKPPPAPRLHLQTLPPVPSFTNATVTTPSSSESTPALVTPLTGQSPNILSAGSNQPVGLGANLVTPSPIKKKLSLGDYMSRRNMSSTPSSEKTQAQVHADMMDGIKDGEVERKSSTGSEVTADGHSIQPSDVMAAEVGKRDIPESAIEDGPTKDDDEPDYSPPDASPVYETNVETSGGEADAKSSATTGRVNPEVASVLAQLAQYTDRARSQSAGSAG